MKLYLAYGANTHFKSMKARCPAARYVANLTLNHHQLVFRGVADVIENRGSRCTCALWLITASCEDALDHFEGFPNFYVKKYVTLFVDGKKQRVMLYVMRNQRQRGQQPPYVGYEQTLRAGYKDCGINRRQLDNAIARAIDWERTSRPERPVYTGKWSKPETNGATPPRTLLQKQRSHLRNFPEAEEDSEKNSQRKLFGAPPQASEPERLLCDSEDDYAAFTLERLRFGGWNV